MADEIIIENWEYWCYYKTIIRNKVTNAEVLISSGRYVPETVGLLKLGEKKSDINSTEEFIESYIIALRPSFKRLDYTVVPSVALLGFSFSAIILNEGETVFNPKVKCWANSSGTEWTSDTIITYDSINDYYIPFDLTVATYDSGIYEEIGEVESTEYSIVLENLEQMFYKFMQSQIIGFILTGTGGHTEVYGPTYTVTTVRPYFNISQAIDRMKNYVYTDTEIQAKSKVKGVCRDRDGAIITGVHCDIVVFDIYNDNVIGSGYSSVDDGSFLIDVGEKVGTEVVVSFSEFRQDIAGSEIMTTVSYNTTGISLSISSSSSSVSSSSSSSSSISSSSSSLSSSSESSSSSDSSSSKSSSSSSSSKSSSSFSSSSSSSSSRSSSSKSSSSSSNSSSSSKSSSSSSSRSSSSSSSSSRSSSSSSSSKSSSSSSSSSKSSSSSSSSLSSSSLSSSSKSSSSSSFSSSSSSSSSSSFSSSSSSSSSSSFSSSSSSFSSSSSSSSFSSSSFSSSSSSSNNGATSGTFYSGVAADDGTFATSDYIDMQLFYLKFGNTTDLWVAWIRFPNITIPAGSMITAAFISLTAQWGDQTNATVRVKVAFYDVANVTTTLRPNFGVVAAETAYNNLTTGVDWDALGTWTAFSSHDTPSLVADLQAVVDLTGWHSGNALMVIVKDDGSDHNALREPASYDYSSGSYKPELHIEWIDPSSSSSSSFSFSSSSKSSSSSSSSSSSRSSSSSSSSSSSKSSSSSSSSSNSSSSSSVSYSSHGLTIFYPTVNNDDGEAHLTAPPSYNSLVVTTAWDGTFTQPSLNWFQTPSAAWVLTFFSTTQYTLTKNGYFELGGNVNSNNYVGSWTYPDMILYSTAFGGNFLAGDTITFNTVAPTHDYASVYDGDSLRCGDYDNWFVFKNINIPPGAIIDSAIIRITAAANSVIDNSNTYIRGINDTYPVDGPDYYFQNARRTLAAYVVWTLPEFVANSSYDSSDIKTIIQEKIDTGWVSGNSIQIFFTNGGSVSKEIYAFENGSDYAELRIAWTYPGSFSSSLSDFSSSSISCSSSSSGSSISSSSFSSSSRSSSSHSTSTTAGEFNPAVNGDDGYWYASLAVFNTSANEFILGKINVYSVHSFVRFPDVTIPQGATIDAAFIRVYARDDYSNTTCNLAIYFNDSEDAVAPLWRSQAVALALTSGVAWNSLSSWTDWPVPESIDTPSLATPIQEVVDLGGWLSGNALMVIIKDNYSSNSAERDAWAVDHNLGQYKAELHITWTV